MQINFGTVLHVFFLAKEMNKEKAQTSKGDK